MPEPSIMSPQNRVVMISGANRGIGLAIARRLHADGYRLSLGARRIDALQTAVTSFADKRVLCCPYDAELNDDSDRWITETLEHYGAIDALVNNAGILAVHDFRDYNEDRLDRLLTVNLKAPYRLTAAALPHLKRCGHGRIVNINSRSGLRVTPGSTDYSISKFANRALTHAPRVEEWENGIRTTAICPGNTDTDMVAPFNPASVTHPDTVAAIVSLVLTLPNNASVPLVPICSEMEAGIW